MRHELHEIVNGTTARLVHILNGIITYHINVKGTVYVWDIYTEQSIRYFNHHFMPEIRPAEYITWIKYAIDENRFKQLN